MKSLHTQIMELTKRKPSLNDDQMKNIKNLIEQTIAGAFLFDAILIPTDGLRNMPHSIKGYVMSPLGVKYREKFFDGAILDITQTHSRRIINGDLSLITTEDSVYLMTNPNETAQG